MSNEAKYYNAFNLIGDIGPVRFKKLSACFGSMENAWRAAKSEFLKCGIEESIAEKITNSKLKINPDAEWEKLAKENISIITIKDAAYPKLLKEIYSPPAILYVRGKLENDIKFPIAVVGSRRISDYGRQAAKEISGGLARNGATIVSGMALGIDTAAHEAAIENNGKTIAVLGCGLDWKNLSLRKYMAEKIIAHGALLSEFPFGMPPLKHHFPMRNRIVSGLSLGVLVIEAAKRSGALITASMALEQNREVFAVPGGIYWPNSEGTNNLIKSGAKAITCGNDILEELNLSKIEEYANNRKIIPDSAEEKTICGLLSTEPLHIDNIAKKAKMESSRIASILMLMEMKGIVRNLGMGNYVIKG